MLVEMGERRTFTVDDILVQAYVDPDDGRIHLSGYSGGKPVMYTVALRGACGKYAVARWRDSGWREVRDEEFRSRTQSVVDLIFNT
jgi:outer membrane protein OmpA-like peptidoglycan-associated protein